MPGFEIAQAYFESLLETERGTPEELEKYQAKLLRLIVGHAHAHTPFYQTRSAPPEDLTASSPWWRSQPFVTRRDLVQDFDAFRPRSFPQLHGVITPLSTGGSTGPAARRDMSALEGLGRLLASYRMYHAWRLDQSRPLFVLRKLRDENQARFDRWGFPWLPPEGRGLRTWIDIATPAAEQLAAMAGQGPVYVNTLPSNILRLSLEALRSGVRLSIPYIVCVGEYLAPEVRRIAAEAFGSTIIDAFSSAEGGVIAVQCPASGLYHIQSEQVLAEVVDAEGRPCAEGAAGEVAVTPLYGYATPLLRYRSGDFVQVGPSCPCGRSLPAIARIAGRKEHMFRDAQGGMALPAIDRVLISEAVGHDRWVLAQQSEAEVEFRHAGPLGAAVRERIMANLHAAGADWRCRFSETADLPPTSGGKRHFTVNETAQRAG